MDRELSELAPAPCLTTGCCVTVGLHVLVQRMSKCFPHGPSPGLASPWQESWVGRRAGTDLSSRDVASEIIFMAEASLTVRVYGKIF